MTKKLDVFIYFFFLLILLLPLNVFFKGLLKLNRTFTPIHLFWGSLMSIKLPHEM